MNREDIIRMARDAGCLLPGKGGDPNDLWEPNGWENVTDLMFKFAALVAAQNRPWVGLTEKEIKSLPSWWPSYEDAPALIQLVKDVEAKLKEKNT
jgi:hypothetical protein